MNRFLSRKFLLLTALAVSCFGLAARTSAWTCPAPAATPQWTKKDYLSPLEADKIRDAPTISDRVKLFLAFAADRLRKIDYELERKEKDRAWRERMSSLINAYTGCVDDAADALEGGLEKQENLRPGVKELDKRTKEFLPKIQELRDSPQLADYKADLEDAIQATQDAAKTAEDVGKEISAGPERRKPS